MKAQKLIIDSQNTEVEKFSHTHDFLASKIHKDSKYLPALLNAVQILADESTEERVKSKALQMLAELHSASQNWSDEINYRLRNEDVPPSTGLAVMDAIFLYMAQRARNNDIDFKLTIEGDTKNILNYISPDQLATLAADLIENAITATKLIDSPDRRINGYLCVLPDKYELSIQDNGIPFEPQTLLNLGKQKATTHMDTGGSGIGYMTVFEIMHKTGASLIINEHSAMFKSVTIRFDGDCQYTIESYRQNEIQK